MEDTGDNSEIEMFELKLEQKMICSPTHTLRELASGLELEEHLWKEVSKVKLLRIFRKMVDVEDEEEKKGVLLNMLDFFSKREGTISSELGKNTTDQLTPDTTQNPARQMPGTTQPLTQPQMAKQVEDLEAMLRTLKTEMGVNNDDGTNKNWPARQNSTSGLSGKEHSPPSANFPQQWGTAEWGTHVPTAGY
jgi:hypothetical protein